MKPVPFLSITLLLAATGAWTGYRLAPRPLNPPPSPPGAAVSSLPVSEMLPELVRTPSELEDLVRRFLSARATDEALALSLHKQILATDSSLLKRTWEELAGRSKDLEAGDVRHVLTTLRFALAEQDPMGTIQWLARKSPPDQLRNQLWMMLEDWSVRDPIAAWEGMIADTIAPSVRDELYNAFTTICANYAKQDPAAAFAAFLKLPPDHWLNDYAAAMLCRDAATPARRMEMLQQLVQQPPGRLRTAGLNSILAFQTQNQSLEKTGTWLLQQPLPEAEKDSLIAVVAASAAPDDPRAALTWLMANSRPEAAMASMERLTEEWASASPNDCGEWLKTLPPGPSTDGALFAFVEEVMQHDPESAFLWTRQFDLPARREARAKAVWEKWVSNAPVSAARFAGQFDAREREWLNLPVAP